ncbi:MAG TPA: prepilin-type N-terminal cleavage/methylation domain-containing protein [Albitalea sp.]
MRARRGFTLIELLVVMAIIGGLLAMAAPRYLHRVDLAKETVLKSDLAAMRDAVDKFFADTGRYPASLEELVAQRYLRKIPPDPITESAESWVVVAPPAESSGVYDVKSGAPGTTLDGRPYDTL